MESEARRDAAGAVAGCASKPAASDARGQQARASCELPPCVRPALMLTPQCRARTAAGVGKRLERADLPRRRTTRPSDRVSVEASVEVSVEASVGEHSPLGRGGEACGGDVAGG
jgi:hypothetical protein